MAEQTALKRGIAKSRVGFSMIELVIVIVIIGIIAAIAIPKMSRGSAAAADSAARQNLGVLRQAIDLYHTEHGGTYPTAAKIVEQLTTFTNDNGDTSATKTGAFIYGPYIRDIPAMTVGQFKGSKAIAATGTGWIYNETTGAITINVGTGSTSDQAGNLYSSY
jgi:prepilin-type N-terminal cleavage/methylation domain-containing protein